MRVLDGKSAVVTGGSRGIGRAIFERLAGDGAAVVFNYARSSAAAADVERAVRDAGGRDHAVQIDLAHARGNGPTSRPRTPFGPPRATPPTPPARVQSSSSPESPQSHLLGRSRAGLKLLSVKNDGVVKPARANRVHPRTVSGCLASTADSVIDRDRRVIILCLAPTPDCGSDHPVRGEERDGAEDACGERQRGQLVPGQLPQRVDSQDPRRHPHRRNHPQLARGVASRCGRAARLGQRAGRGRAPRSRAAVAGHRRRPPA